jgi:hypothetical protein
MQVDKKKDGSTALLSLCERPNFASAAQCASTLISFGADARISAVVKVGSQVIGAFLFLLCFLYSFLSCRFYSLTFREKEEDSLV